MKYEFNGTIYDLPDASPHNLVPASITPHASLPGCWVVAFLHTINGCTGHATTVIVTKQVVSLLEAAKRGGLPAPEQETLHERRIRESEERGER